MKLTDKEKRELYNWCYIQLGYDNILIFNDKEATAHDSEGAKRIPYPLALNTISEVEKVVCEKYGLKRKVKTSGLTATINYQADKTHVIYYKIKSTILRVISRKLVAQTRNKSELLSRSEALWEVKEWTEKEGK